MGTNPETGPCDVRSPGVGLQPLPCRGRPEVATEGKPHEENASSEKGTVKYQVMMCVCLMFRRKLNCHSKKRRNIHEFFSSSSPREISGQHPFVPVLLDSLVVTELNPAIEHFLIMFPYFCHLRVAMTAAFSGLGMLHPKVSQYQNLYNLNLFCVPRVQAE